MDRQPTVYMLASQTRGTIYTGVTSDLMRRLWQHRTGATGGFTVEHGVRRLVHVEPFETMYDAIAREKRLKRWRREWKVALIETHNPTWRDLALELGFDVLNPKIPPSPRP